MTLAIEQRSLFDVFVREPIELVKDQPHQVLLSAGSVAIMASFASSAGIVDPVVGYLIAGGVEWAYLRGIASDARARSGWGTLLSWSAFFIVVLWGVLWVLKMYGVLPARPTAAEGVGIGLAHIVPVAWLSLCSAMCHRTMLQADAMNAQQRQQQIAAQQVEQEARRLELELKQVEEDRKFERWKEAQRLKHELSQNSVTNTPVTVSQRVTTPQTADRSEQRTQVVTVYKTAPRPINVTQEAARIGISRGMWYKLRDAALNAGELTQEEI